MTILWPPFVGWMFFCSLLFRILSRTRVDNVDKMYIMLWLDEKSYDEIAEIVGVGRNNVAIRIHRIKEKLKKMSNR